MTGFPFDILQLGAEILDRVCNLRSIGCIRSLHTESHLQDDILGYRLRDEPESQGTVLFVQVVFCRSRRPGRAGQVGIPFVIGIITVPAAHGTVNIVCALGGSISRIFKLLRESTERHSKLLRVPLDFFIGGHVDHTSTIVFQVLEFNLGDDRLCRAVIAAARTEFHAGESMIHQDGCTIGKVAVVLLFRQGRLSKKDVLLPCGRIGRFILEFYLLILSFLKRHTCTCGIRGHIEIEIDRRRFIFRPRVASVIAVITPAVAHFSIRICRDGSVWIIGRSHVVILIHDFKESITEISSGIDTHARIERANIHSIGRSALRLRNRIQLLDSLFQEEGIPLLVRTHRDGHTRDCIRSVLLRGTCRYSFQDKSDIVFTKRSKISEILLPLAGDQHCSCYNCQSKVKLSHNSLSFRVKIQNRTLHRSRLRLLF